MKEKIKEFVLSLISMLRTRTKVIKDLPQDDAKLAPFFSLYKYASGTETTLIIIGAIASIAFGACPPLISIIFGGAIGDFDPLAGPEETLRRVIKQCLLMIWLGIAALGLSALSEITWTAAGERLGVKVRTLYLESVMKKSIPWFDENRPQELPTKISSLVAKYQGGIGEKVGKIVISIAMGIVGLIISFIYGWQLALVLLGLSPITMFAAVLLGFANSRTMETTKRGYAKCGGYAEEALSAIRTVYAFCAEQFEKNKYLSQLSRAQDAMVGNSKIVGIAVGLINLAMSLTHGLGYLLGSFFIQYKVYNYYHKKDYNCAYVMTVFFAVLFAMMSLGMIAPQLKNVTEARMAAYDIYELIDSVKDAEEKEAAYGRIQIPDDKFKGKIEFKNVTFRYPSRKDVKVLDNFSFVFEEGKMTGICGETGSGKSTIIQLIERFYYPDSGEILIDGYDLKTLDIKWWRGMIGYVGQEPVLFNSSIEDNIRYATDKATFEEIKIAAAQANLDKFIETLPNKYATIAGAEGSQISGGQKQRIAIARALLKKPKILLLDEATSALDNSSELQVQESFNKIQQKMGMTILAIAHRLSTIKKADKILVLHDGVIAEEGTDKELRDKNTIYANLCRLQNVEIASPEEVELSVEGLSMSRRKSSMHEEKKEQPEEKKEVQPTKEQQEATAKAMAEKAKQYSSRLWSENWNHCCLVVSGIFLAALTGVNMPAIGILFGMVSIDLLEPDESELRRKVNLDFIGFISVGVGSMIVFFFMIWVFGYIAAQVTYKLRGDLYNHIFKMHVGWFDLPTNTPSSLNSTLAEGTEHINGVIVMIAGTMIQSLSALIFGLAISFGFSWKMALFVLACVPPMAAATFVHAKFHIGFAAKNEELYKGSMGILTESVKNFRTVASFCSEQRVIKAYSDALAEPLASSQYAAIITGILFGIGQLIPYLVYAGLFYFAAYFQTEYGDDPKNTFVAVYSLLFAAQSIGQSQQYAPDMGKAYAALFSIYGIQDQLPAITSPEKPVKNEIKGKIEFKNVCFKYPTRDKPLLIDFSCTIEAGKKYAIVGISGSGKTTIIQLIERFYDVESGEILIDGVNIKDYSLADLRHAIGYVPQEPVLFDSTIEQNVKYGKADATHEEIEKACEIADAAEFIEKSEIAQGTEMLATVQRFVDMENSEIKENFELGTGYGRRVGAKGAHLSGGQKQRVAIARAVLKNPKIMLFDEATSALDSGTEKVVQRSLKNVSQGRTTIVIAHRLGTIEEDDTIIVLEKGKVAEMGSKKELLEKKGNFYKLYGSTSAVGHQGEDKPAELKA